MIERLEMAEKSCGSSKPKLTDSGKPCLRDQMITTVGRASESYARKASLSGSRKTTRRQALLLCEHFAVGISSKALFSFFGAVDAHPVENDSVTFVVIGEPL